MAEAAVLPSHELPAVQLEGGPSESPFCSACSFMHSLVESCISAQRSSSDVRIKEPRQNWRLHPCAEAVSAGAVAVRRLAFASP
jgi:hypothetical protein